MTPVSHKTPPAGLPFMVLDQTQLLDASGGAFTRPTVGGAEVPGATYIERNDALKGRCRDWYKTGGSMPFFTSCSK
jgi:hypothetical protein